MSATDNTGRNTRRYLYAITDAPKAGGWGHIGINGAVVAGIVDGEIAAVVSNIAEQRVRPERAHLASHNAVLKLLMQEKTVLPVAFGTIARSVEAVRAMLAESRATFLAQLAYVKGRVEMGLRVRFDVPDIYGYFVNAHGELRALRDTVHGNQGGPSRDEKIELGRRFDRLLAEEREIRTAAVLEALAACCVEIKRNPPRNETEVMNLACLIERADGKTFENAVLQAASRFDNNYAFDLSGPWAPHNFVHVTLEERSLSHAARR